MTNYTFKLWKNPHSHMPDRVYINADGMIAKVAFVAPWSADDDSPLELAHKERSITDYPAHLWDDPKPHKRVAEEALEQAGLGTDLDLLTWTELLEVCE